MIKQRKDLFEQFIKVGELIYRECKNELLFLIKIA
jgi:hypothetical protein